MNKKTQSVLILGGGLTGLSAGVELSRAGWQVTVLESEPEVGGLARTFEKDGFKFDTGPHRWFTKMKFVNNWMNDIFKNDFVKVERLTRIYFDKKFFFYPMRLENLKRLGLLKSVLIFFNYVWHRVKTSIKPMKINSMEDAYISQFGPMLYRTFFKRYSEKLWGHPCSQLSGDWVSQRSRKMSLTTIIKDLFFRSKGEVVSLVDSFNYPKQGISHFSETFAQIIKDRGGQVLTNAQVVEVKKHGKRIQEVKAKVNGKTKTFKAEQFISTIPLPDFVNMVSPSLEAKVKSAASKLEFRAEVQVTLFLNKAHVIPDTWLYVHPLHLRFVRFMPMDNWSEQMNPKGKSALVFELVCDQGDETWTAKDQDLVKMVKDQFITEFKDVIGVKESDIIGSFVKRLTHEYPVYLPGYQKHLKKIKSRLYQFLNLQIAGRNGIFRYNNMDHSIAMGLYSAWNLTKSGKFDIENINTEDEYHEEKKTK